ncbi:MAG: hypothetical protein PHS56_10040, partial [Eubacteriales bacterium]|nr:hypothetical protein [Eubacteriales bacterium]
KLLLEHLCLLSVRFPGKKDRAKGHKKTGPPPVGETALVFCWGSKKAQTSLPVLLDYTKFS